MVAVVKVNPGNARLISVLEIERVFGPLREISPGVVIILVLAELITSVWT